MDAREIDTFDTSLELPPHAGQRILHAGAEPEDASIAMILLHGRGSTPEDIISLADGYDLPGVCYLAPAAAGPAYTLPGQEPGGSWYPQPFTVDLEKNRDHFDSAHAVLESLLSHLSKLGLTPERCVLGGFSQGACLATNHAYQFPRRYGLIVGYSGGLPGKTKHVFHPHGDLEGTPVELSCGDRDIHIPWKRVEQTAEVLTAMNADVTLEQYPGLPHSVSRTQVDKTTERLQALLEGAV